MAIVMTKEYPDVRHFYHDFMFTNNFVRPEAFLFRGQANADWKLVPYAFRKEGIEKLKKISGLKLINDKLESILMLEASSVKKFCIRAFTQGINIELMDPVTSFLDYSIPTDLIEEKFPFEEYLDAFALAQHYQVPTRLLDWSRNVMVALYFAVSGALKLKETNRDGYFVLWMLNMEKTLFCPELDMWISVPSYADNPNIMAQQGVMTYSKAQIPDKNSIWTEDLIPSLDELIKKYECLAEDGKNGFKSDNEPMLYRIKFPYSGVGNSAHFLYRAGYTHSRIFPGLAGIVIDMENPMA